MRRRAFLASLGTSAVAFAGCLTDASDAPNESTTRPTTEPPTTDRTTTEDGEGEDDGSWPSDRWSVVTLETQPRTLSLFPTQYRTDDDGRVEAAFAETATADNPARVRAKLTNAGGTANTVRLDEHPPFSRSPRFSPLDGDGVGPANGDFDLYFAPLPDQSLPTAAPATERGPDGVWRLSSSPTEPWFPDTHRLDAGESVTVEFAVVGEASGSGSFEEANYEHPFDGGDDVLTLAAWNRETPGPESESRFAGESFPAPSGDDETGESSVAWFHEATEEQSVYLRPSEEATELPETLTFSLVNRAEEPATGNPYDRTLYKLVDGEWQKLQPRAYPLPMGWVSPGDVEEYVLRASNDGTLPGSEGIDAGYLGGGTYAFEVGMSVESRTHAAVFELDAPSPTVEPSDAVSTMREDGVVTVTDERWERASGRGVVTVSRAEATGRVVSPELAARRHGYRNTLPFFEDGVEEVHLRTSDGVADWATDIGRIFFREDGFAFAGDVRSR
jgi:hypothetical protein